MTTTVNIHEAKTHLSRLLQQVSAGERIIIARAGKPVAELIPVDIRPDMREPGSAKGLLQIAANFDAPLPQSVIDDFEGE